MTRRDAGRADRFLEETCEMCNDLLFEKAHVAKDNTLYCNEQCRVLLHAIRRRAISQTHPLGCLCLDCAG